MNPRAEILTFYYVRLRHGAADQAAFDSQLRPLQSLGADDLDIDAAAIQRSITPQAVGWELLAALAALAGLAVIGQAAARQFATDDGDHEALAAMGLRARQFVVLGLARALLIGVAGAAGAVVLAAALSPLTPVGEARLAAASPGALVIDPLVTLTGTLATVVAVVALSAWPAVRHARLRDGGSARPPAPLALSLVRSVTSVGAPPSVLIGIRYALERGRGRRPVPVGTALLGTVMAVAALCATAVFGASLTWLVATPALYGAPFQAHFSNEGTGSGDVLTGTLPASLRRDPAIDQITLAAVAELNVNGRHVRAVAVSAVRGPALVSAVDGRLPRGDQDLMLGAATMRGIGARPGGGVRVTVSDPVTGADHTVPFRVVGRASFPPSFGTGGFGSGAALTVSALVHAQCPPGTAQPGCEHRAQQGLIYSVLVRAAPGRAGAAALARYTSRYRQHVAGPEEPAELVNFGESVNFPLLFGAALALFGAATLIHLLLVSVYRRRAEAGLLKVLGFVRYQVAALTVLACGVLAAANILAVLPAWLAARSSPAQLLRSE